MHSWHTGHRWQATFQATAWARNVPSSEVSIGRWIIRLSTKPSYMPKLQCGHFIGAYNSSVQETRPKLRHWILGESVYLSARCTHVVAKSRITWMGEELGDALDWRSRAVRIAAPSACRGIPDMRLAPISGSNQASFRLPKSNAI